MMKIAASIQVSRTVSKRTATSHQRVGRAVRQLNRSRDDSWQRLLNTVNPIARSASGGVSFQHRSTFAAAFSRPSRLLLHLLHLSLPSSPSFFPPFLPLIPAAVDGVHYPRAGSTWVYAFKSTVRYLPVGNAN